MTAINFDFVTAFISVVILGYEPAFRFVYEKGLADDFVICYDTTGKDIIGFGHCHGYWIDIDAIVEDWFNSEDVADIPDLYDFYYDDTILEDFNLDFCFDASAIPDVEDDNWFDEKDVKDIPDFDSPNWGAIMAVAGKGICKDIFDWFDILSIPEVGAFNPEDIFDMSGMA